MLLRFSSYGLLLLLFAACSGGSSTSLPADSRVFKESTTASPSKLDILWVIDENQHHASLLSTINSQMDSVFSRLFQLRLDFRMASVSANLTHNGILKGNPTVIHINTWNIESAFSQMIDLRTPHPFVAQALDVLPLAIANGSEFLREDAALVIIFIASQDQSQKSVAEIASFLHRFKTINQTPRWMAHALSDCDSLTSPSIEALVTSSHGKLFQVCNTMDNALKEIVEESVAMSGEIQLPKAASPEHLQVTNNSIVVPNHSEHGWWYHTANHSIRFHGDSQPSSDAIVRLQFTTK